MHFKLSIDYENTNMEHDTYTGIFAEFYDKLFGDEISDLEFYKHFVGKDSALEIGSGTGRLLIPMLQEDMKIDAIEPNSDMTKFCIKKAKTLNLEPMIHQQNLQNLSINKKYKTIFMPLYAFQHILNENEALIALQKTYEHLQDDGQVLISVFIPEPYDVIEWTQTGHAIDKNQEILLYEKTKFDHINHIEHKELKFEVLKNNELQKTYYSSIEFKIYALEELKNLLNKAGFKKIHFLGDYLLETPAQDSSVYILHGKKN